MTPEERAQQTLKMEELEAERDLVEEIRAGVAAAAKVNTSGELHFVTRVSGCHT